MSDEKDDKNDTLDAAKAFISKGVDAAARGLLSPLTAAGAVAHATGLTKTNPLTLESLVGGLDAPTERQTAEAQALEAAHPIASTAGSIAGAIAGSLPAAALGGGVASGTTSALGGGIAARLAGAVAGGATEGATYGLSSAANDAELQRQQLDGEHALASAGLGALLGGALRFGGAAIGEALTSAGKGADKFADLPLHGTPEVPPSISYAPGEGYGKPTGGAPATKGLADIIAEAAGGTAEKATKLGLKAAGLAHGLPGYLFADAAGDAIAPKVADAVQQNAGVLGAIAQRGARAASSTVDAALGAGRAASPGLPSATSVFVGKFASPEAAYAERANELHDLAANNGEGIRASVEDSLGTLAHQQPGAVVAMTNVATNGVRYLLDRMPGGGANDKSLTPLASSFVPPRADLASFMRIYAAVMRPQTVLADIRRGTVTSDQIDAVKTVYPQWYQDNVIANYGAKLQKRDVRGERLLPSEERVANLVLGTNTGLDSVDLGLRVGSAFTPQRQAGASQGGGSGSKQPRTPTDAILGEGR